MRRWDELVMSRMCRQCGREFNARRIQQWYCRRSCSARAWRAVKRLEGTYGPRPDGSWGRL
jgi:hypothetical protein